MFKLAEFPPGFNFSALFRTSPKNSMFFTEVLVKWLLENQKYNTPCCLHLKMSIAVHYTDYSIP